MTDPLLAPVPGAVRHDIAGVQLDIVKVGDGRVKRVIYPTGFRWSTHMGPLTGTTHCEHTHVGFLVKGRIHMEFAGGRVEEFIAPQAVMIESGHDGWVVGGEPAVLIEFDFLGETAQRFGLV
jgi:hypothetical protein